MTSNLATGKLLSVKGQNMNEKTKSNLAEMSADILATSQDLNAILATGGIKMLVRTHYVNTEREIAGIEQLIRAILQDNGAVFPRDSHLSEMRPIVLAKAMRLKEIENEVRKAFGNERYVDCSTLRVYLNSRMSDVCTIKQTAKEDKGHYKTRPNRKYYLAE